MTFSKLLHAHVLLVQWQLVFKQFCAVHILISCYHETKTTSSNWCMSTLWGFKQELLIWKWPQSVISRLQYRYREAQRATERHKSVCPLATAPNNDLTASLGTVLWESGWWMPLSCRHISDRCDASSVTSDCWKPFILAWYASPDNMQGHPTTPPGLIVLQL